MGWEIRNGNRYYYRKRWYNGTCISEYVGRGFLAEAIATLEQLDQERQRLTRITWQQERVEIKTVDRQIDELCSHIRTITRAVLRATGHHRHKGQWRKKRMKKKLANSADRDRVEKIVGATNTTNPKPADVKALRKVLNEFPDIIQLSNMAAQAATHAIDEMEATVAVKEVMKRRYETLLDELGYSEAAPLEKLLIWQVCLAWVRLAITERYYTGTIDNTTLTKAIFYDKRLNAAQRCFLRACETLARVRKLASRTPEVLQVNIANQQVNQVTPPPA